MKNMEEVNFLLQELEKKLKRNKNNSYSTLRKENLEKISKLYHVLELSKKHPDFSTIFNYKAMNLAGIGLKNEDFGEIRKGKYVQIISISYEVTSEGNRNLKNSSLGYYGKAEKLNEKDKNKIIEFVLRWRYEKSFQHSDYYQQLLDKLH